MGWRDARSDDMGAMAEEMQSGNGPQDGIEAAWWVEHRDSAAL